MEWKGRMTCRWLRNFDISYIFYFYSWSIFLKGRLYVLLKYILVLCNFASSSLRLLEVAVGCGSFHSNFKLFFILTRSDRGCLPFTRKNRKFRSQLSRKLAKVSELPNISEDFRWIHEQTLPFLLFPTLCVKIANENVSHKPSGLVKYIFPVEAYRGLYAEYLSVVTCCFSDVLDSFFSHQISLCLRNYIKYSWSCLCKYRTHFHFCYCKLNSTQF